LKLKIATFGFEDIPIPPVKGGAVEIIIDQLSLKATTFDWHIFSKGDPVLASKNYRHKNRHFYYYLKNRSQALFYALKHFIPEWAVFPHWVTEQIIGIRPDIIILHYQTYLKYLLKIKNIYPDVKILIFIHNDPSVKELQSRQLARCYQKIDGVICVSHYVLSRIKKYISSSLKLRMFCMHNASHLSVKLKNSVSSKVKTVLFVGRLVRHKGAYLLLEALGYIKNPNIKFIFVGSAHHGKDIIEPEFLALKESMNQKAQNKLTLTGFIPPTQTQKYYDQADLVVFPSLWQEPSGLVLFEAWARGIPVLATRVGGIPELVDRFKHAQLVSPKITPQKLAATIESLLKNKNKLKNFSKNGLQFAKNYGNFERMAKDFESIVASVLSDPSN